MSDAMREAFEHWWRDYNASIGVELSDVFAFERDEDGRYERISTQAAWEGWQAALEHAGTVTCQLYGHEVEGCGECTPPAPVVPDGWKLVPVEPTTEMLDAWFNAKRGESGEDSDFYPAFCAMLGATPKPLLHTEHEWSEEGLEALIAALKARKDRLANNATPEPPKGDTPEQG